MGGGVMGAALAYWLTRMDPTVSVTVIKRDPSYTHARALDDRRAGIVGVEHVSTTDVGAAEQGGAIQRIGEDREYLLASVTFGGADLSTVHLGGLRSTSIPLFRSPVAGLPMLHWS